MIEPRRNTRTEEGERTKREIIRVALDLFAKQGYAKTTITQIAAEAETYRSSIDWHFKGKEGLLIAVVEYYLEEHLPRVTEQITREFIKDHSRLSPREMMLKMFVKPVEQILVSNLSVIMAIFTLTFEEVHHNPKLAEKIRQFWNDMIQALESVIRQAQKNGQVGSDIDPLWTARSIIAIFQGMFIQWYIEPENQKPEEAMKTVAEAAARLLNIDLD